MAIPAIPCFLLCAPSGPLLPFCLAACGGPFLGYVCGFDCIEMFGECTTSAETQIDAIQQMQIEAAQFCAEHPEECQEYSEAWLQFLEEEAEE